MKRFPAVVVTGARQVGKSTLLRHALRDAADFVVFDPVVDVENARRDPELFLENHRTPLVLDEVHYAPELLPSLERRVDRDRSPGRYVLTGSQQWGVLATVAESLAGRAAFLDLDGFSLRESLEATAEKHWLDAWLESPESVADRGVRRLGGEVALFERIWRGSLPEAHFLPLDTIPDFHLAFQRTYIERDARLLAEVADWQQFGRFARLVAALTGQELNRSQLGREIGVSPRTAERWLGILRATFQWFEVPAYFGNTVKRVASKGYVAETGFACHALAISTPNAVASRPSRGDTTGITAFRKTYPKLRVARGLVVAPSEAMAPLSENDWAMPWDAVARAPAGPARRDAKRRGPFPKGEAAGRLGGAESDT